jgi:hypothetical protein
LTKKETEEVFAYVINVDNTQRLIGFKIKIAELVDAIMASLVSSLIERTRLCMNRAGLSTNSIFQKYDKNKDGVLS